MFRISMSSMKQRDVGGGIKGAKPSWRMLHDGGILGLENTQTHPVALDTSSCGRNI